MNKWLCRNKELIRWLGWSLFLEGFSLDWTCLRVSGVQEFKKSYKPWTQSITLVFSTDKQVRAASAAFVIIVFVIFVL